MDKRDQKKEKNRVKTILPWPLLESGSIMALCWLSPEAVEGNRMQTSEASALSDFGSDILKLNFTIDKLLKKVEDRRRCTKDSWGKGISMEGNGMMA